MLIPIPWVSILKNSKVPPLTKCGDIISDKVIIIGLRP